MSNANEWLSEIAERMKAEIASAAAATPERLTVREFVGKFGYAKRGAYIANQIRNALEKLDLRTNPDFEGVYMDSTIAIEFHSEATGSPSPGEPDSATHRIGTLEAANKKPVSVKPDDPLRKAATIMQLHDYSRLPVMTSERDVKGVISWQSIGARLALGQNCECVRDCMEPEPAREIPASAPLFNAIGDIAKNEYVLVRGEDKVITGIVTSGDISNQFMQLAGPFLLIGEIEGHLRRLAHGKFTVEEMQNASPEGQGNINGLADLTLGGYCQLLGKEEHWGRLNLNIDRKEFVKHLDSVRKIRNDIMHFDPDGLVDEDVNTLEDVARFLASLVSMGAM